MSRDTFGFSLDCPVIGASFVRHPAHLQALPVSASPQPGGAQPSPKAVLQNASHLQNKGHQ